MLINLKTRVQSDRAANVQVTIQERIPANIMGPCVLDCDYTVERPDNYYLLKLYTRAQITIICQRCLHPFAWDYTNQTSLAVCESEEQASRMMGDYECLVTRSNQVDLVDLLTDELYLYSPEYHPHPGDCDKETSGFLLTDDVAP